MQFYRNDGGATIIVCDLGSVFRFLFFLYNLSQKATTCTDYFCVFIIY